MDNNDNNNNNNNIVRLYMIILCGSPRRDNHI